MPRPRPIVHQAKYVRARARYTVLSFGGRLGIRWRGTDVAWPSVWFFLPRGAPTFPPTRRAWHGTPHGDFCSAMDGVDVVQSHRKWVGRRDPKSDGSRRIGPWSTSQPSTRKRQRPRRDTEGVATGMEAKQMETGPEGIRVVGWDEDKRRTREGEATGNRTSLNRGDALILFLFLASCFAVFRFFFFLQLSRVCGGTNHTAVLRTQREVAESYSLKDG